MTARAGAARVAAARAGAADRRRLAEIERRIERDLAGAERSLRALLEAHPADPGPRLLLAKLCLRRSGFADMRAAAEAALALAPASRPAAEMLAYAHYYLGQAALAAEGFARVAMLRPQPQKLDQYGCCLLALGRLDEAADCFRRSLAASRRQRKPRRAVALFQLARLLRDRGEGAESDRLMERLLALYRDSPLAVSSTLLGVTNRLDFPEWDRFRKKAELHEAIAAYRRAEGAEAFPYHPRTWVMPRDHEAFRRAASHGAAAREGGRVWIVKPSALFGGQGVRLVEDPGQVEPEPGTIVQDYIADPYLLGERKAHLRLYLLITAAAPPRVYFWRDGIVRFAPERYRAGAGWLDRRGMHITNTALHLDHPELALSDDPTVEDAGSIWSLRAYVRHIGEAGGDVAGLWDSLERLAGAFARLVAHSGLFARQAAAPTPRAYPPKFVGLDVLLDAGLRPWLLESQRMPGQVGAPLIEAVNGRLFRTITEMIAAPLGGLPPERWARREAELEDARRGDFVLLSLAPAGAPGPR